MRPNVYHCNVFEKTDSHPLRNGPGRRHFRELDQKFLTFLRQMKDLARYDAVDLRFLVHRWPTPQVDGPDRGKPECEQYAYLDDPPYRADFAVCFAGHPWELGPEIAHLLHGRENWIHHLLIVTRVRVADDVRRGFTAISPSSVRPEEETLYEPVGYDPSGDTYLSFFKVNEYCSEETVRRIRAILVN